MIMTDEDQQAFEAATECHICKQGWELDQVPVRQAAEPAENLDSDDDEPGLDEEEEENEEEDQHQ